MRVLFQLSMGITTNIIWKCQSIKTFSYESTTKAQLKISICSSSKHFEVIALLQHFHLLQKAFFIPQMAFYELRKIWVQKNWFWFRICTLSTALRLRGFRTSSLDNTSNGWILLDLSDSKWPSWWTARPDWTQYPSPAPIPVARPSGQKVMEHLWWLEMWFPLKISKNPSFSEETKDAIISLENVEVNNVMCRRIFLFLLKLWKSQSSNLECMC